VCSLIDGIHHSPAAFYNEINVTKVLCYREGSSTSGVGSWKKDHGLIGWERSFRQEKIRGHTLFFVGGIEGDFLCRPVLGTLIRPFNLGVQFRWIVGKLVLIDLENSVANAFFLAVVTRLSILNRLKCCFWDCVRVKIANTSKPVLR
jgi:hypothetical protein